MSLSRAITVLALTAGLRAQGPALEVDAGWLPDPLGPATALRVADMNGDGFADLVRLRSAGVEMLLQDPATGRFARVATVVLPVTVGVTLRDVAIGRLDASGDGRPDLAVLWSNGEVDVVANGGSTLTRVLPRPVATLPVAGGSQVLVADLSGDGRHDLLVLLDGQRPQLLLANGTGGFVDATLTHVPAAAAFPRPRGLAVDVDGDLDVDVVLASSNSLPPLLLQNQGNGVLVPQPGALPNQGMPTARILALQVAGSPLPELVFGLGGTVTRPPVVLANAAGSFATNIPQSLQVGGVVDIGAADLDGDGALDLVVLQSGGEVGYALQRAGGQFEGRPLPAGGSVPRTLVPADPGRAAIALGDLEGDGDADLAIGGDCPEQLLLQGAGTTFTDTERLAFPNDRRRANVAAAMVDRDGNGDLDYVGLFPTGDAMLLDNDGSGTFAPIPASGPLPVSLLPNTTVWRRLRSAAVAGPSARDLVAVGDWSGVGPQVGVLVNAGGGWVDQTSGRFGGALTGAVVDAVPLAQPNGRDGLVVGTFAGELEWHANVAGVLTPQSGAFASGLGLFTLVGIEVGDVAGDARPDVVAVSSASAPRLFVATNTGFVELPGAFPPAVRDRLRLVDLDLDQDLDALVWVDGAPGLVALLYVGGAFVPAPGGFLPSPGFAVVDAAVVTIDGLPQIVLARTDGATVQMPWNGAGYGAVRTLPWRGQPTALGLLTADVDRDGDVDVLLRRDHLDPVVLNNEQVQLVPMGLCASGRAADLRFQGPQAGALTFLMFGAPLVTSTPHGLLRLDPASLGTIFVGLASATRETSYRLTTPPGLPYMRLPLQAAWLTQAGAVRLSGLEFFAIAP